MPIIGLLNVASSCLGSSSGFSITSNDGIVGMTKRQSSMADLRGN